jgi:transcriptional regulator with XRE-family HTH domain
MNIAEAAEDGTQKSRAVLRFAAELRAQRRLRGWSQVALGEKIGYSGSFISDVERCWRSPTLDFAKACDRGMNLPGTFVRFHEAISLESFQPWFASVLPFETGAVKIHDWDMRLIDGLIQTEDYARAVVRAGLPDDPDDVIERHVTARMERQEVFSRERPVAAWFVICESVLRRVFGSPKVMRDQLDKLIELTGRAGIKIQVLPLTVTNCPGADGPMTIFDMPDGTQAGYAEGSDVGRVMETPSEVAKLKARFDMLRAAALPPGESVRLIERIRDEYGK